MSKFLKDLKIKDNIIVASIDITDISEPIIRQKEFTVKSIDKNTSTIFFSSKENSSFGLKYIKDNPTYEEMLNKFQSSITKINNSNAYAGIFTSKESLHSEINNVLQFRKRTSKK